MNETPFDPAEEPVSFVSAPGEEFVLSSSAFSYEQAGPPQLADELVRNPPVWLRELIERGASLADLVRATGHAALAAETREERLVVSRTLDLLTLLAGARKLISYTIGDAVRWTLEDHPFRPPIVVYDNENISAPGRWAWLIAWEEEVFYPVSQLQQLQLNQAISAVTFHPHTPTFAELFLFDGPDLQGSFVRIVQERSLTKPPHVVLTPETRNNQARSLLGSVHLVPGRRFSATDLFTAEATTIFLGSASSSWGTISLVGPPRFSWWPYVGLGNPPQTPNAYEGSMRVRFDFHIDDVLHGPVDGVATIGWPGSGRIEIPPPWAGSSEHPRWGSRVFDRMRRVPTRMEQQIAQLAPFAHTLRILPGRSLQPGYSAVFSPTGPRPPQVTTGSTTEDATIVLNP